MVLSPGVHGLVESSPLSNLLLVNRICQCGGMAFS